ncbi:MAG: DUF131 domain-containing protein [Thermoplasmata archaeon]|nr:DUF131 domain-containing protein [Thermoplasmata archaeon]
MGSRIPQLLFISGTILLFLAFLTGEGKGGIFIIFPFFYGSGIFSMVGILLIFLSFLSFFFSFPHEMGKTEFPPTEKTEMKTGGIIFIGPIPIVFSSDEKMGRLLVTIAILIAIFIFALLLITQLFPF